MSLSLASHIDHRGSGVQSSESINWRGDSQLIYCSAVRNRLPSWYSKYRVQSVVGDDAGAMYNSSISYWDRQSQVHGGDQ